MLIEQNNRGTVKDLLGFVPFLVTFLSLAYGVNREEGRAIIMVCCSLFSLQSEEGKEVVRGARVRDALTGEEWDVRAKVVINATGT